jgi:hypothetical protein
MICTYPDVDRLMFRIEYPTADAASRHHGENNLLDQSISWPDMDGSLCGVAPERSGIGAEEVLAPTLGKDGVLTFGKISKFRTAGSGGSDAERTAGIDWEVFGE